MTSRSSPLTSEAAMSTPDEYVEITALGDPVPKFIISVNGQEVDIAKARALFLANRIDVFEYELRVGTALGLQEPPPTGVVEGEGMRR